MNEGPALQTFHLHKDIAVKFSDFLAAASRNGWREAAEGVIKLPEQDSEVFAIFEAFIYNGCIYSKKEGDEFRGLDGVNKNKEWARLSSAWLLGETLQASAFKDAVVDAWIDLLRSPQVPLSAFVSIYPGTVGKSPMKELLIDVAIWGWHRKTFEEALQCTSGQAFLADVAVKQSGMLEDGRPKKAPYADGSTCIYHEHGEDKPCYRTMFK